MTMKFDGGYNVMLEGPPAAGIASYEKPDVLHLPLFSRRLDFSLLQVADGDTVQKGQVMARDPVNFSIPLLAPVGGTVNLETAGRHITLENLSAGPTVAPAAVDQSERQALVEFGVWSSFAKIDNNRVPDPESSPDNLVVPVTRFEPYYPDADTLLAEAIEPFIAGLVRLHKMLDQAEVLLVVDETGSDITGSIRQAAAEHGAWLKFLDVPELYPFDSPVFAARQQGCNPEKTWTTDVQAVLAVEAALEQRHPYVKRVVSVSGPMAAAPAHHQLPLGYPLAMLTAGKGAAPLRVINGGILTGAAIDASQLGIDSECQALTVLEEQTEREVLAFVQPGFTKRSYSRTFVSFFKPPFMEKSTTALGGEARPCVFCGFCEQVCPAGIIPHLIYRYLDHDRIEDAYRVEFEKCIDCGLCSYVCVSKINHLKMFRAERRRAITETIEG
jgi:Na(+)-translocating NADH:ubiquinone oxidoreductase A subunit